MFKIYSTVDNVYCITYLKEELEFNQSGEGGGRGQISHSHTFA